MAVKSSNGTKAKAAAKVKQAEENYEARRNAETSTSLIEPISSYGISEDFSNGGRRVEVTDLLTNKTFTATWEPNGEGHAHIWFTENEDKKPSSAGGSWSTDARSIMITATDDDGMTRYLAYGWIPYPHYENWNEKPFHVNGEMCIFNGSDVAGYGRDYGNEAAYGAFTGDYRIVPLRAPK